MTLAVSLPMRRWILAAGILVVTVLGLVGFHAAETKRSRAAIATAVAARKAELTAQVAARLQALELRAQNAGSNPRLVAAISAKVNIETLRDLFENEEWGQALREGFAATYLAAPGQRTEFLSGATQLALDVPELLERVRETRWVGSALVAVNGWAHIVVAVPVVMPGGQAPVLLLTQPFDGSQLGAIAERTGEAVILSDGRQVLAGAGKASETAALKGFIGREAALQAGSVRVRGQVAVAATSLAPGLSLLGHLNTTALVAQVTSGLAAVRVAIGVVGCGLFLAIAASILVKRKKDGPRTARAEPAQPAIAATVTEASSGSRYTLLQRIGGGGMAEVHLAVSVGERGFRRPCVIKRLRPELSENPAAVAQFTDEATLASSLVHANIVPIFDFARVGAQYFLVEEYIVGRDLGRLSRRARSVGTPLTPDLVAFAAVETLKALDYAHSKRDHDGLPLGIVHRDISPENLMVTVRGEVQLLDFGVIKVDEKTRKRRTDIGELKGNLSYIAPEQARGLAVDGRADLFALGMVIYFALTGEPLYGADAGYDLLVKAAAGPGVEEMAKLARLPAPFSRVLPRALAPRPEGRYPTAVAFAEAFGPSPVDAAARLGILVARLFGDELADEQNNLSLGVAGKSISGTVAKVLPGPGSTSEQPVPLPLRGH